MRPWHNDRLQRTALRAAAERKRYGVWTNPREGKQMSAEENKALVIRIAEDVWNQGNLAAIDELMAPGGTLSWTSHAQWVRRARRLEKRDRDVSERLPCRACYVR